MTTAWRTAINLALGLMLPAGTAAAASQQHIGSWVLSCPSDKSNPGGCRLRFEKPLLDSAGITADLEIQALGKTLVPVIALRGLPPELLLAASMAGKTEASMQFAGAPRQDLACAPAGTGYMCWPTDQAAEKLAAALPTARSVRLRVTVTISGMKPLPVEQTSVDLAGTGEALARLRTAGPTQVPPLSAVSMAALPPGALPPGVLIGMADRALKAAGYPNGLADLQALLAKYRGK